MDKFENPPCNNHFSKDRIKTQNGTTVMSLEL